jgi:hypothetical protein
MMNGTLHLLVYGDNLVPENIYNIEKNTKEFLVAGKWSLSRWVYRVIQEERPIFWEAILSNCEKNVYMNMCNCE